MWRSHGIDMISPVSDEKYNNLHIYFEIDFRRRASIQKLYTSFLKLYNTCLCDISSFGELILPAYGPSTPPYGTSSPS